LTDNGSPIGLVKPEDIAKWREGVHTINEIVAQAELREKLHRILDRGLVEPLPISFQLLKNQLSDILDNNALTVLLNVIVNATTKGIERLGASEETIKFLDELARRIGPKARSAFVRWNLSPLTDWFRVNTQILLRDYVNVNFLHMILRNDGTKIEFSGNVPSTILMAEHFIRQVQQAANVLGVEAVLGNVNPEKLDELSRTIAELADSRRELENKIDSLRLVAAPDEDATK